MADITIYKPASLSFAVIDGDPPVDQTALVAQLQQQVASLEVQLSAALAKIAAAKADLA